MKGQKKEQFEHAKYIMLIGIILVLFVLCPTPVLADTENMCVDGKVYEYEKNNEYNIAEEDTYYNAISSDTYGTFCLSGNVALAGEKEGVPSYEVKGETLALLYDYTDTMLNAEVDEWHLVEDKTKKVNGIPLGAKMQKGAIIVQISKDRKNWLDAECIVNVFSDMPIRTSPIYDATDIQLINGCFYKVTVAYEISRRTEDNNIFFINTDKYENKKVIEVYEFFAFTESGENSIDYSKTYRLGSRVRVKNFDGYFGEELIEKDDIHYGWELGDFFVSGYTDEIVKEDTSIVLLKNVGDKVTLWFKLNENINALRGDEARTITADEEGYDQYFETPKMDFGRGVLIIRYIDHNNVKSDPIIYTNYLEANATVGTDVKVRLFEEGDYEVALDYEITEDKLIDKEGHYRIFFRFSVRNSNCMVYPFDVKTGSELTNSSMTENGFRLDLAQSKYLTVNIKREVMKDSADGLIEDTRFNGRAKEGVEYTGEGIYTITVYNEYTNESTIKKIYVGTNSILRAHMTTGLSILEINSLVEQGATISEDGTIQMATVAPEVDRTLPVITDIPTEDTSVSEGSSNEHEEPQVNIVGIVVGIAFVILGAIVLLYVVKNKKNQRQ